MTIFVARIRHLFGQFSNLWGTPQGLDTLARVLSLANHINCLCHSWIIVWVSWGYHPYSVLLGFCLLALTWFPSPPHIPFFLPTPTTRTNPFKFFLFHFYPQPPPGRTHFNFFCFIFIHRLHQDEPILHFFFIFI